MVRGSSQQGYASFGDVIWFGVGIQYLFKLLRVRRLWLYVRD